MSLQIIKPGLLTTVQDTGRYGFQKDGMVVSGAMDTVALRLGNLLVGNQENEAALEITLVGPSICFTEDHLIALTGADFSSTLNGKPLKMWRPIYIPKGSTLEFGPPKAGCRSYLAVAGGIGVPEVMGSSSTYLRARMGGFLGRALQADDTLPVNTASDISSSFIHHLANSESQEEHVQSLWSIDPKLFQHGEALPVIRALKGPEYDLFTDESKVCCWESTFKVSLQSDRMGYRLQGVNLDLKEQVEMLSTAVTFGTVQVPPEGNPIVLMADHQTTGGYPRIAQVITADLPTLAQVMPGSNIQFTEVTLEQAQRLYLQQEQTIEKLKQSLHLKLR